MALYPVTRQAQTRTGDNGKSDFARELPHILFGLSLLASSVQPGYALALGVYTLENLFHGLTTIHAEDGHDIVD